MSIETTRRGFITIGSASVVTGMGATLAMIRRAENQTPANPPASQPESKWEKPAALDPKDVQAFVGVAHRDVDRVREMLDAQPALVNAAWDWGSGDWETALGAAGHTGRAEIAELLLSRGARIELHAAAMLGWLDFIKAAVAAQSGAENILGPHAIPMHSHARDGGERAREVLAYLESLNALRNEPVADEVRAKCAGRYRLEDSDDVLTVFDANRRLILQPPGRRAWYLLHQGKGVFVAADDLKMNVFFDMYTEGADTHSMNIKTETNERKAMLVE